MSETLRYGDWTARPEVVGDTLDLMRARAMQATLDREERPLEIGDTLPPLWHWLYFWQLAPGHALGEDGHAARGAFLPPVDLPRRMWAGGRLRFHKPLPLGVRAERRSQVVKIEEKQGKSGRLVFVTARHEIRAGGEKAVTEEQDIVYREASAGGFERPAGRPAPDRAEWRLRRGADPVLLFRYSALTFNGHRIHYDVDFAREEEGYPGLVVHGPLLATLLMELFREKNPRAMPTHFDFRALRPVFDGEDFAAEGSPPGRLWIADAEGCLAMEATIEAES